MHVRYATRHTLSMRFDGLVFSFNVADYRYLNRFTCAIPRTKSASTRVSIAYDKRSSSMSTRANVPLYRPTSPCRYLSLST